MFGYSCGQAFEIEPEKSKVSERYKKKYFVRRFEFEILGCPHSECWPTVCMRSALRLLSDTLATL